MNDFNTCIESVQFMIILTIKKFEIRITHKNVLHYWKHSLFNDLVFELKMQIQIGFYFMRLFFLPAFLIVCKRSM